MPNTQTVILHGATLSQSPQTARENILIDFPEKYRKGPYLLNPHNSDWGAGYLFCAQNLVSGYSSED